MKEPKLKNLQINWNPDEAGLPPVALVWKGVPDDNRYDSSWGACNADFAEASPKKRLNMLFRQFVHLTAIEGIDARVVHDTFMDIPEYRKALAESGSIDPSAA